MANESTFHLSMPEPDIALLTIDMPGKSANILSKSVLAELSEQLDALESRTDLAGLAIISAKPNIFIAGADLREFVASMNIESSQTAKMCGEGQKLFGRLSKTPFPTVAVIDGICVGGGAELAVWCDRRIMSNNPKTEIGFPEVRLGLFPGWGGTARTPRMIGLSNAVEMITGGASIGADEAFAMGLANDVVPVEDLQAAAVRLIRLEQETGEFKTDREKWNGPVDISETELGFLGATASAVIQQQTKGHYPAPLAALEVMMAATEVDIDTACQMEAEGMASLFGSPINAALLNVFFLTDRNKKDTGVERDVITREVNHVAVIGAGIMGAGIAAANVKRKVPLTLSDANETALGRGVSSVLEEVSFNRATRTADVKRAVEFAPMINGTTSDTEIARCDVVIEAVVENIDVKREIFARLEPLLADDAIMASNTSTIPITTLAEGLARPEQFCGIHFFNPVRKMKLVEVIRGEKTNDETVATAVAYAKRLGKSPIVVNDGPGFLVNRLLFPYMNEALELVREGVEIKHVESVAKKFGMPMGPITLYDMVGLDTALYAGRIMWEAFPSRIVESPILPALVDAGRLGQKSGKGFFDYNNRKRRAQPDPDVGQFIEPHLKSDAEPLDKGAVEARLFLPMLLEATRVLESNIVRDARDVDLGLIFGVGFPPFKGGLLFWADTIGAANIIEMLKPFEQLGERMKPTALLEQMAAEGSKFYK